MSKFAIALIITVSFLSNIVLNADEDLENLLAQHKGKVVLVDFWASWCGPCLRSFPWMNALSKELNPSEFAIIAINVDSDKAAADKFLQEHPANFSMIYDPEGEYAKQFEVDAMPSSFLISRIGDIVHHQRGFQNKNTDLYRSLIEIELKQ